MEDVVAEDLMEGHMEAVMKIQKRRMKLVAVRIKEEKILLISRIRVIEIKEEEEEDKDLEEEASMEHVFTVEKKVIGHLNVLNTKEGWIGGMKARLELHM